MFTHLCQLNFASLPHWTDLEISHHVFMCTSQYIRPWILKHTGSLPEIRQEVSQGLHFSWCFSMFAVLARIKWKWSNKIVQSSQHSHFILVAFYLLDSFVILLSSAGRSPVELIRKFASCVLKILYVPNIVLPAQHFLMHFRYWKIIYLKCIPEIFMEEEQYYLNIFLQILDRIKIAILLHEKWRIKACS